MVRAPCCDKMGLKRGPWTLEEDRVLIDFISLCGHGNWRALPKQAGLMRCGKSCRLRWTNYLRPDIKRGNFTGEEEDTIINLHRILGNRWSAIAARLPGRTDNEIKNVWHTHLKKRLKSNKEQEMVLDHDMFSQAEEKPQPVTQYSTTTTTSRGDDSGGGCYQAPLSPQPSSSSTDDISSSRGNESQQHLVGCNSLDTSNEFPEIDESFWWSEVLPVDNTLISPLSGYGIGDSDGLGLGGDHSGMEFWYEMFNGSGGLQVDPETL